MGKTVCVGIAGDDLQASPVDVIEEARRHCEVVIGLLTDAALSRFLPLPALDFSQRKRIFENVVGVTRVVLRAAYPAMRAAAESILCHGRAKEAGNICMAIPEFLNLAPAK